ncbi:DNA-binding transcriptional regulator YdaS (Cro superfamily) [Sphingomonas sp. SORGH_AS870]|uniref:hypothetical protein n=1 Tax=Sphingomonas sp. SORGH_AS_0870 TaxID=3041801 RepID=UPI0028648451|nr:hypothetical protein [Sphingomonas sp. SORGH_AS_0870]MDR6144976.1 DNA-binding transcriptional regulator YdaS (Cro superfamily) [Sphingomonas sp. SORGH_AS_0870]
MTDEQLKIALAARDEALEKFEGNQSAFERETGVKQQTLSYWLKHDRPVSPLFVLRVATATGIPASRIRPDMYPEAPSNVLPCQEAVEGVAPIVPGDRRAISQCVKS